MLDLYLTGHEMTTPYDSGLSKDQMSLQQMRLLTATLTVEEEKSPWAFHYYEPRAALMPEHLAAIKAGPLPAERCFMPGEVIRRMMEDDSLFSRNGYGVMENGVGYAAAFIRQEGVDDALVKAYRENFAVDPERRNVFYKIWCPGNHYIHFTDGIIEDFGWGPVLQDMDMSSFRLSHVGMGREDLARLDPDCFCLLCAGGTAVDLHHPEREPWPMFMIQYRRQDESGRTLQIIYYNGLRFLPDGSLRVEASEDRARTEFEMKCMMTHGITEYCNELRLMKGFRAEMEKKQIR